MRSTLLIISPCSRITLEFLFPHISILPAMPPWPWRSSNNKFSTLVCARAHKQPYISLRLTMSKDTCRYAHYQLSVPIPPAPLLLPSAMSTLECSRLQVVQELMRIQRLQRCIFRYASTLSLSLSLFYAGCRQSSLPRAAPPLPF